MSVIITQPVTLEEFLKLPETKPTSEYIYINGKMIQNPMPKGRDSRLQGKLCCVVNEITENQKIAYGFTELKMDGYKYTFAIRCMLFDQNINISYVYNRHDYKYKEVLDELENCRSKTEVLRTNSCCH
jgi:hypothetical protein